MVFTVENFLRGLGGGSKFFYGDNLRLRQFKPLLTVEDFLGGGSQKFFYGEKSRFNYYYLLALTLVHYKAVFFAFLVRLHKFGP